jgi:membrane-bound serine protease (ClpP class)
LLLLVTGFAGVGNLPFSWAGLVLLVAGVVLLVAEALMPGFGVLGVAGLVSLVLGVTVYKKLT